MRIRLAGIAAVGLVSSLVGPPAPRVGPVAQAPALSGAQPISSHDRVYTADQVSNTVTVIDPKTDEVLGTIPLGHDRLDQILGPVDSSQVNVHGELPRVRWRLWLLSLKNF